MHFINIEFFLDGPFHWFRLIRFSIKNYLWKVKTVLLFRAYGELRRCPVKPF